MNSPTLIIAIDYVRFNDANNKALQGLGVLKALSDVTILISSPISHKISPVNAIPSGSHIRTIGRLSPRHNFSVQNHISIIIL